MNYPLISEYVEAIKLAEDNLDQLSHLRPVLDNDGRPVMSSGNFAVVFKMRDERNGKLFALKCFTREQEERSMAYHLISKEIESINANLSFSDGHKYLVNTKYLDAELFVDSCHASCSEFPVLLMEWVEGITLDRCIKQLIAKEYLNELEIRCLKRIALNFLDFAYWMCELPIAHGDIKPDNIIITKEQDIVLVDYDGMFVPKMKGQKSRELGSPNYRHPNRTTVQPFDLSIDDFSLCVIAFSLAAIAINRDVYNREVDDALVLSEEDFSNLNSPTVLSRIGRVLHDKICSSLFASILMQIGNPNAQIDIKALFGLKSYLSMRPPIYLPFKVAKNTYLLFDTDNGQCVTSQVFSDVLIIEDKHPKFSMIVSTGGEIDYSSLSDLGDGLIRVTDFILFQEKQKRRKANKFALISNNSDINNLQWFDLIKPLSSSVLLAKDNDSFGIISTDGRILLPFEYKQLTPLVNDNNIFIACKNHKDENGLFRIFENAIVEVIDVRYNDESWHYNDGASNPNNLIIFRDGVWRGYDLERNSVIPLPSNLKRVKSYSEQILSVEVWDSNDGLRLYNTEEQSFINDIIYKTVGYFKDEKSPFKNGVSICETENHKNVIVFKDGSSYVIPYETHRLLHGYSCKYVFFNYQAYGNEIEITIFDYRTKKISSFVYHWKSGGMKCISVVDDQFVEISSHNMKYNWTSKIATLDLLGNPVEQDPQPDDTDSLKIDSQTKQLGFFDEQTILSHIINTKYLDKKHIPMIDKYESVEIIISNGYAIVDAICDVDPEFGVSHEFIGYADAERCYWNF